MANMIIEEFKQQLYDCDCTVYDLDNTLVEGRVADGVGKSFLKSELFRGHIHHVILGAKNYKKVLEIAEKDGEVAGLEYFMNLIAKTGCATYQMFYQNAREYIEKKNIPDVRAFMHCIAHKQLKTDGAFISTLGADVSAEAAKYYFPHVSGWIGNPLTYKQTGSDTLITGIKPVMRNGEEKLQRTEEMLQNHGLSISKCFTIGNDENDHAIMKAARLSAASPLADEPTKDIANIYIPSYSYFLEKLKAT
ncbi:MAG: HAD hydrolase family protein [Candidatus Aenigmatarchaeota archaeon]